MRFVIPIMFLLSLFASCGGSLLTDDQHSYLQQLQILEERAAAELAEVRTTGDPAATQAAEAKLADAKKAVDAYETEAYRSTFGPVWTVLTAVPIIGPTLGQLGPLVLGFIPLLSRRGRKHYGSVIANTAAAVTNLLPGATSSDGTRGMSPALAVGNATEAVKDIGRAFGLLHSSEATKLVAEGSATITEGSATITEA